MTEEERAAAYLASRRAMVAARNARLARLSGSDAAERRVRDSWERLLPPFGATTADEFLGVNPHLPQEV